MASLDHIRKLGYDTAGTGLPREDLVGRDQLT